MYSTPSPTGDNGRDANGHFAPGNKAAKGNPHARRVQRLRSELLRAVKPSDLRAIVEKLVEQAKGGDIVAARELFDRLFGKSQIHADVARSDGMQPAGVVFDDNWYGNAERLVEVDIERAVNERLLNDTEYHDYLRAKALAEDAGDIRAGSKPRSVGISTAPKSHG